MSYFKSVHALEYELENKLVRYCDVRGWQCLKLRIDGENGFPDRTIITPHGIFFAELKRPGGKLRARQVFWLKALKKFGLPAGCYDDYKKLIGDIEKWEATKLLGPAPTEK